jgi:hypothetical protein
MKQQDFTAKLDPKEIEQLNKICTDAKYIPTADDAKLYMKAVEAAAEVWGEDQISEAVHYILMSAGGLRPTDLQKLIGEDWQAEPFCDFVNSLGFPLIAGRQLMPGMESYFFTPQLREELGKLMSAESRKSFSSDIAFHLLELPENDPLRLTQTMHLLLDSNRAFEAAKYLSDAQGEALKVAIMTLGQGLRDAPEEVKQCIWDMTNVVDCDRKKMFLLLINDVIGVVGNAEKLHPIIDELHDRIGQIASEANDPVFSLIYGIAKLRQVQNARLRRNEQEAQNLFGGAITAVMSVFEKRNAAEISYQELELLWLSLRICQEMAQIKAVALMFDALAQLETAKMNAETEPQRKTDMQQRILNQHIELSKLYHNLPEELRKEFKNYGDATISLLSEYLNATKQEDGEEMPAEEAAFMAFFQRAALYQALGEICLLNNHVEEARNALTEAQIKEERLLGQLIKKEGSEAEKMSQEQLMTRLTLSVTNHLLASVYRQQKNQHDLKLVLETNVRLSHDCIDAYPNDGRVIHFIINAALEAGDFYQKTNSFIPAKETYQEALKRLQRLQNMRVDETLCRDVALLHTKMGQLLMSDRFRDFTEAKKNLNTALMLWNQLAQNTRRQDFKNNAESVAKLLQQLK